MSADEHPYNQENPYPHLIDDVIDGHDKKERKEDWIGILIHHTWVPKTADEWDEKKWKSAHNNIASYLARKDNKYVSAHYQIGRMGELTQIVNPDYYVAYHAGKSSFWHPEKRKWLKGCNDYFIGIELLGDGNTIDYTSRQLQKLIKLCQFLYERFDTINPLCIVGHEMVSPGRKVDPGYLFDWKYFYEELFNFPLNKD